MMHEATTTKPKLPWRPQEVRDARKWNFFGEKLHIVIKVIPSRKPFG